MGIRAKTGFSLVIQLKRRRVILSLDPVTITPPPTSASIIQPGSNTLIIKNRRST
jgi:hypothetical protein